MGIRVNFLRLVILLTFTGIKLNAEADESPDYTQYVHEVTSSFLKQVYKEFGFECGASGGEMPYDVEVISVKLVAYRAATIEEAREFEILLTEKFAQIINAHEKIRPFLRECPFPSNRAHVAISFRKPRKKGSFSPEDDVTFVFQAKNKIFYQKDTPGTLYGYVNLKDEPYEEARKIVQENTLKASPQKSPKSGSGI